MWFNKKAKDIIITAPISGKTTSIENANDEVFRKRMIGDGIVVIPDSDTVVAPIDGKISMVVETGHAYGIVSKEGLEVLIHIGIDTVKLKGEGFCPYVEPEQTVKRGQVIAQFDKERLEKENYNVETIIIFPNGGSFALDEMKEDIDVIAGQTEIVKFKKP